MIDLYHIKKTYHTTQGNVEALKDVSLHVDEAEIFGIIGYSGAGKSTLIRCMNLLERPDYGKIVVLGQDLTSLAEKELCCIRRKIGMIFQHFNLLRTATVFQNVAFPIQHVGLSKNEIRDKVESLLELVGLSEKQKVYPSQLSGGQKQRVAIARALASEPKILLSDEATSALDPQTTYSILSLLDDLNHKLGLTIVMITHQMQVVKEICSKVAVLDDGVIVEEGPAINVFSNPVHPTTKEFVSSLFQYEKMHNMLSKGYLLKELNSNGVLVHLIFTGNSANEAYISQISRLFEINASVVFGNIEIIQSQPIGSLFVIFNGDPVRVQSAFDFLRQKGVNVITLRSGENFQGKEEHSYA